MGETPSWGVETKRKLEHCAFGVALHCFAGFGRISPTQTDGAQGAARGKKYLAKKKNMAIFKKQDGGRGQKNIVAKYLA